MQVIAITGLSAGPDFGIAHYSTSGDPKLPLDKGWNPYTPVYTALLVAESKKKPTSLDHWIALSKKRQCPLVL